MASSSVSQESLDMDEFETTARRNRIRVHRGHGTRGSLPYRPIQDRNESPEKHGKGEDHSNGDNTESSGTLGLSSHAHHPGDHESPTRGAAARLKDKRSRINHAKGKLPKDKRKLREKRRSTGVVHCMPSTESTGDSLDEDDDDEDNSHDTKRNTTYNEGPGAGYHHQPLYETRHSSAPFAHKRRNKSSKFPSTSPSDLEADLEDNQDYDSTVSHSETNLTLIGRSETSDSLPSAPASSRLPGGVAGQGHLGGGGMRGNIAKYSPESNRAAFKFASANNASSDADSPRNPTTSTSSSSSVLSRYRELDSPHTSPSSNSILRHSESDPQRRFSQPPVGTTSQGDSPTSSPFSASAAISSSSQIQPRPVGFSVFRDNNINSSASPRGDKHGFSNSVGSSSSRYGRDRDVVSNAAGTSSVQARLASYQSPRPYVSSPTLSTQNSQQSEAISQLEKQVVKEKEENQKLKQQLEEKDKKIAELEKAIELLNTECDGLDEDNLKLQEENKALIRAMSKLTTNV